MLYFLEDHLKQWIAYIQCIWQIFLFNAYCYFKVALAAIYLRGTVIISGGNWKWSSIFKGFFETSTCSHPFFRRYEVNLQFQLQPLIQQLQSRILSSLFCFCRTGFVARRYHVASYDSSLDSGMHILNDSLLFDGINSSHQIFMVL